MPDYGRKLKEIRQSLSMTQEELAAKLGLNYRAYTSYERNENKPPLSMLDMLLLNFDINLNWFISDKGGMFNTSENSAQPCKQDKKELTTLIKQTITELILENGGDELLKKILK